MGIRTKIVATLGPERPLHGPDGRPRNQKVEYRQMVPWFVEAGVDVFRLNMSHRSKNDVQEHRFLEAYRETRFFWETKGRHVAIMGDLQGPKIRIGSFFDDPNANVELVSGKDFALHTKTEVKGDKNEATVIYEGKPFAELIDQVKEGDHIWLGDGEALLKARKPSRGGGTIICDILSGGVIKGGRGVTIKGVSFDIESFTAKDKRDLELLLSFGDELTYVALSFVKTAEDVLKVKDFIKENLRSQKIAEVDIPLKMPGLIAKIETQKSVDNIAEILDVADGIMVARGDLGMQVGLHQVAGIQKRIIHECNVRGKPVITATQMLDSMERNPIPTRAEVTDVYNAILDGTDAVMLSGETSEGFFPTQAIRMMHEIAAEAEKDFFDRTDTEDRFFKLLQEGEKVWPGVRTRVRRKVQKYRRQRVLNQCYFNEYRKVQKLLATQKTTDRVSHAACSLSVGDEVAAIIAPTTSGQTTRMVARFRPRVPIVGAAHDYCVARTLTLCFGVYPVNILRNYQDNEAVFKAACESAKKIIQYPHSWEKGKGAKGKALVQTGDLVIITAGHPLYQPGTTNLVKLHTVDG